VVTVTDRRSEAMSRRYRDVCELDAQLRLLFPAAVFLEMTDLRQPQLMRAKKTSEVCHMCHTQYTATMCAPPPPPFVHGLSYWQVQHATMAGVAPVSVTLTDPRCVLLCCVPWHVR
jgi:hypothetical protein